MSQSVAPSPGAAIRGSAVSIGPSLVLDALVLAASAAVITGRPRRPRSKIARLVRLGSVFGAAFPAAYFAGLRPWHRRWGATDTEIRMPLPGDEQVPDPGYQHTRAVTIHAPADQVWQWLVQVGQNRGGFYSYDWLENMAGCQVHSADRVHPEWQSLHAGDLIAVMPGFGPRVAAVEPGGWLAIERWGTFVVQSIDARTTRLIVRARQPRGLASLGYLLTLEIPHFIMERKMLLGIKERAERAAGETLLGEILPVYDFRGVTEVVIRASRESIYQALRAVTLGEMPLAYALGTLRYLPGLLTGRMRRQDDELHRPFFEVSNSPILAEKPNEELVLGTIGRLHNMLDQQFVPVADLTAFRQFHQSGFEKLAMSIRIAGGDAERGHSLIFEHRTQALDPEARWKFSLYWWLMIRWGSEVLVRLLLDAVKRRAER